MSESPHHAKHNWAEIIVNPADPNQPPKGPYIELTHDGTDFMNFPWHWKLYLEPPETERHGEWQQSGICNTRIGAKWAARRAYRKHLKALRRGRRPTEIIPIRPPSDG